MAEVAALGLRVDGADGIDRAAGALDRLAGASESAERSTSSLSAGSAKASQQIDGVGRASDSASSRVAALAAAAKKAGALLAAAFGIGALKNYADSWSDMQSKVGSATGDMANAAASMRRLTDIANASYSPLQQTAAVYARNVATFRDLGRSSTAAADFTEALNHALVTTATRGQDADVVVNSLSRALATGGLNAMDFDTIVSRSPRVLQAMADKLGVSTSAMRALAASGLVTSDVIASGLIESLDALRKEAAKMPATLGDAFVRVQNNLTEFVGRIDKATGASSAMADAVIGFADGIRRAGDYVLAFGVWAAPAFELARSGLSAVAEYADIAVIAMAGFYAPALIGGIATLTGALAVGLVGAIKAVTAAMLANPIGLLVSILAAAGYAAYKLRDQIKQAIGVDVVATIKSAVNSVIGAVFVGVEYMKATFENLGDAVGAWVVGGMNVAIRVINELMSKAVGRINSLIEALSSISGIRIGAIGEGFQIEEFSNEFAKRLIAGREQAIAAAMSRDYLGELAAGFNLPGSAGQEGGGGSGGSSGSGGGAGAKKNTEFENMLAQYHRQINLATDATEVEKLLYEAQFGRLKGISDPQQKLLLEMAEELDSRQKLIKASEAYNNLMRELRTPSEVLSDQFRDRLQILKESGVAGDEYARALERISRDTVTKAPEFGGLDASVGGFSSEVLRINEAQGALEKWRSEEIERQLAFLQQKEVNEATYAERILQINQDYAEKVRKIDEGRGILQSQINQEMLANAGNIFGDLASITSTFAGEQSAIYKTMFAVSKAFSIAQSIVAIQTGIAQAAANPFPANLAAMASVAAATSSIISNISSVAMTGFQSGGYTGNRGINDIAGVVHGREFVFDAAAVARIGIDNLEAIRRGQMPSNNPASPSAMTAVQSVSRSSAESAGGSVSMSISQPMTFYGDPDQKTVAMIKRAVDEGGRQVYKLVASSLATGKGDVAKGLSMGYGVGRRKR